MTVKEIAKLAGVSRGTVDRVINKRGQVSREKLEKISSIIEKHKFTPNLIARRLKSSKTYNFCAMIPRQDQDSGYWKQAIIGIQEEAKELSPLGINTKIIEFDHYNQPEFQKTAKSILNKNPDGIIFPPYYPEKQKPFIKHLNKTEIPYVFIDSDLPGAKPVCSIYQDPIKGGYLAGRIMHLLTGSINCQVAVLDNPMSYHMSRRKDGFMGYFNNRKSIITFRRTTRSNVGSIIMGDIGNFLQSHRNLAGIFITYVGVNSVAEAAEKLRKKKPFFIIGYDLVPANYKLLKEGKIDAIISQRPQEQGRQALISLYKHVVLESDINPVIEMPLDVYFRENLPDENSLELPIVL